MRRWKLPCRSLSDQPGSSYGEAPVRQCNEQDKPASFFTTTFDRKSQLLRNKLASARVIGADEQRRDTDSPVWLTGLLLLINRISHLARLAAGKVGKACRLCETEGYGGRRISQIQGNPNPDAKIHHHHHAPSPIKAAPRQRRLAAASIVRAPIEPTRPHPLPSSISCPLPSGSSSLLG